MLPVLVWGERGIPVRGVKDEQGNLLFGNFEAAQESLVCLDHIDDNPVTQIVRDGRLAFDEEEAHDGMRQVLVDFWTVQDQFIVARVEARLVVASAVVGVGIK